MTVYASADGVPMGFTLASLSRLAAVDAERLRVFDSTYASRFEQAPLPSERGGRSGGRAGCFGRTNEGRDGGKYCSQ
jgi:hypothetical protein